MNKIHLYRHDQLDVIYSSLLTIMSSIRYVLITFASEVGMNPILIVFLFKRKLIKEWVQCDYFALCYIKTTDFKHNFMLQCTMNLERNLRKKDEKIK